MRLRPYENSDQEALTDIWLDGWRSVGLAWPVVTRADMAERVPKELASRWTVTIAELDRCVVGFLALAVTEGRLDQLFIRPEAQGHGVGSALFEAAVARLPEGFWLSTQAANHRARKFYEDRGMTLDRIEGQPGEERVIYAIRAARKQPATLA